MAGIKIMIEGWVEFKRFECKEGTIDVWMGDSADNPNNKIQSNWHLNSFTKFFRLNNGEWIHGNELIRGEIMDLLEMFEQFTSDEIWNGALKFYNTKINP